MDDETEVIKQQMLETRTSLTEKLEALEDQVASTVRNTTEAVTETASAVKGAVENTVNTVKDSVQETVESVKESLDLSRQMENHPWLMLGGAVLAGYVGARLLSGAETVAGTVAGTVAASVSPPPAREPERFSSTGNGQSHSQAQPASSFWDAMLHSFQPTISKLEELAIGATSAVVGDMIVKAAPEGVRSELTAIFDELTRSLGGKPMKGPGNQSEPH